jgi:hypothetical protein
MTLKEVSPMSIGARCGSGRGRGSGRVVVSATATVVVHGAHYP